MPGEFGSRPGPGDVPNPDEGSGKGAKPPGGGSLGKRPDDPGIGKGLRGKYGPSGEFSSKPAEEKIGKPPRESTPASEVGNVPDRPIYEGNKDISSDEEEIGEAEKRNLVTEVSNLVVSPRFSRIPGNPVIIDMNSWETTYRKGKDQITVKMPVPGKGKEGEKGREGGEVSVQITTPLFETPEGLTVLKFRQVNVRPYNEGQPADYYEGTIVWDNEEERPVPSDPATIQSMREQRQLEEDLGFTVVTQTRYKDALGALMRLNAEDQVHDY